MSALFLPKWHCCSPATGKAAALTLTCSCWGVTSDPEAAAVAHCSGPGSHFCGNIGRSHASNHVYFVVDFAKGVFAQKCHDPDCGGFRRVLMLVTQTAAAALPLQ